MDNAFHKSLDWRAVSFFVAEVNICSDGRPCVCDMYRIWSYSDEPGYRGQPRNNSAITQPSDHISIDSQYGKPSKISGALLQQIQDKHSTFKRCFIFYKMISCSCHSWTTFIPVPDAVSECWLCCNTTWQCSLHRRNCAFVCRLGWTFLHSVKLVYYRYICLLNFSCRGRLRTP